MVRFAACQPPRRSMRRSAFTLVELLVVIAIIGILVALLLPAVQAAREAARRTQCLNNITQLSLAVHSFEFHFEHLPAGCLNPDGPVRNEPTGIDVGWIVQILPYMEQRALSSAFDRQAGAYAPANSPVRATVLAVLQCPSDPEEFLDRDHQVARSSYVGCYHDAEAPIDEDCNGLLVLNGKLRYSDIFDGSSQTMLLGEALTGPDRLGWVSGTRATLRNTSSIESGRPRGRQPAQPGGAAAVEVEREPLFVGGFGSHHPGGINVSFADGSSRFLSENLDREVLKQLGNRSDGELPLPIE